MLRGGKKITSVRGVSVFFQWDIDLNADRLRTRLEIFTKPIFPPFQYASEFSQGLEVFFFSYILPVHQSSEVFYSSSVVVHFAFITLKVVRIKKYQIRITGKETNNFLRDFILWQQNGMNIEKQHCLFINFGSNMMFESTQIRKVIKIFTLWALQLYRDPLLTPFCAPNTLHIFPNILLKS